MRRKWKKDLISSLDRMVGNIAEIQRDLAAELQNVCHLLEGTTAKLSETQFGIADVVDNLSDIRTELDWSEKSSSASIILKRLDEIVEKIDKTDKQ
jgi:predicted  nucleic acid-binding Zn-ribbon protein